MSHLFYFIQLHSFACNIAVKTYRLNILLPRVLFALEMEHSEVLKHKAKRPKSSGAIKFFSTEYDDNDNATFRKVGSCTFRNLFLTCFYFLHNQVFSELLCWGKCNSFSIISIVFQKNTTPFI